MKYEEEIKQAVNELKDSSVTVNNIVYQLVSSYTTTLDNVVHAIERMLKQSDDLTDDQLARMSLDLASALYSAAINLEYAGIQDDIAKMARKIKYNKALVEVTGKVVDKQSLAEIASEQEAMVSNIASSAYKQLKARVEYGNELLQSIKKVLTVRIAGLSIKE